MFTIEITYTTGGTFHQSRETECIDFHWDDVEKAKQAMAEMKEFIDFHSSIKGWGVSPADKKTVLSLARKMPWASDYEYDLSAMMIEDNTGTRQYLCMSFCTGYFENLESARIVLTNTSELCYDHIHHPRLDVKDIQRKYGARKNG